MITHETSAKFSKRFSTGFLGPNEELNTVGDINHGNELLFAGTYQFIKPILPGSLQKAYKKVEPIIWHFQLIFVNPAQ